MYMYIQGISWFHRRSLHLLTACMQKTLLGISTTAIWLVRMQLIQLLDMSTVQTICFNFTPRTSISDVFCLIIKIILLLCFLQFWSSITAHGISSERNFHKGKINTWVNFSPVLALMKPLSNNSASLSNFYL